MITWPYDLAIAVFPTAARPQANNTSVNPVARLPDRLFHLYIYHQACKKGAQRGLHGRVACRAVAARPPGAYADSGTVQGRHQCEVGQAAEPSRVLPPACRRGCSRCRPSCGFALTAPADCTLDSIPQRSAGSCGRGQLGARVRAGECSAGARRTRAPSGGNKGAAGGAARRAALQVAARRAGVQPVGIEAREALLGWRHRKWAADVLPHLAKAACRPVPGVL